MSESEYIHNSHNLKVLLYHFVCPAKYRRVVFNESVDRILIDVCLELSKRYYIYLLEICTDINHVHFLVQSVPLYSVTKIITIIKSITACEIFRFHSEVRRQLWGDEFWSDEYFVNTVSKFGDENSISRYVREQVIEKEYKILYKDTLLTLF